MYWLLLFISLSGLAHWYDFPEFYVNVLALSDLALSKLALSELDAL